MELKSEGPVSIAKYNNPLLALRNSKNIQKRAKVTQKIENILTMARIEPSLTGQKVTIAASEPPRPIGKWQIDSDGILSITWCHYQISTR